MHVNSYWAATAGTQPSRQRLNEHLTADVVIIGAGFTGLSTAYHLQKLGYRTVTLDEYCVGWGASGRNGSLMLIGYKHNLYKLAKKYGVETTKEMLRMSLDGIDLVHSISTENGIECELSQRGSFLAAYKPSHLDNLKMEQEYMLENLNYENTVLEKKDIHSEINSPLYHGGLIDRNACYLHPLKYAIGLAEAVEKKGGQIFEQSKVTATKKVDDKVVVSTPNGQVTANHLVVSTNGYTQDVTSKLARSVMPVGSYILTTEELSEEQSKQLIPENRALFDTKNFLYYFRMTKDHRLLFGGRVDYRSKESPELYEALRKNMLNVFPQLEKVKVDYTWGGNVALTYDLLPHIGQMEDGTYFALGYSGHGVSLSTLMGKLLSYKIDKKENGDNILDKFYLRQIPLHDQRALVLSIVGSYFRFQDWVS